MADLTRRDTARLSSRDPLAFARDLLSWDPFVEAGRAPSTFVPRFEVKERADAYVFTADMPGVKDEDLDLSLQNGVLTISGSRAAAKQEEGETYYVYERQYGSFSRSFALPELADPDKVDARLNAGVLTLTVGKRQEARPRKIGLRRE